MTLSPDGMLDFESWYRTTRPRIAGSLVALTGVDDAVDAADEAFARALARWDRVSAMRSPEGWVFKVALNVFKRRMRRSALEARLHLRLAQTDRAEAAVPDADLWRAVRSLPERQRMAVVLYYVADLGQEAVADAMGVRRGTVASALADARRSLQNTLSPDDAAQEVPHETA